MYPGNDDDPTIGELRRLRRVLREQADPTKSLRDLRSEERTAADEVADDRITGETNREGSGRLEECGEETRHSDADDDPTESRSGRRKKRTKKVSKKQIAANGANALLSTGPRTDAGKSRSSHNATKHGAYARTIYAIEDGLFKESKAEVQLLVDGFISGLAPRDVPEELVATEAALRMLGLQRVDRLEVAAAGGDGTLSSVEFLAVANPERYAQLLSTQDNDAATGFVWSGGFEALDILHQTSRDFINLVGKWDPGDNFDLVSVWERAAWFVRNHRCGGRATVKGLWEETRLPATHDEWRLAFFSLVDETWPDRADAERWGRWFRRVQLPKYSAQVSAALAAAARQTMSGALEKGVMLRARITSELMQLMRIYAQLQARRLPPRNEPI